MIRVTQEQRRHSLTQLFPNQGTPPLAENLRKIPNGVNSGHVFGTDFIKFSDSPDFLQEIEVHKTLEKLFKKYGVRVKIPKYLDQKTDEHGIVYAQFELITVDEKRGKGKQYVPAIIQALREFKKIPKSELQQAGFKEKNKQDYLQDVENFFIEIEELISQLQGRNSNLYSFLDLKNLQKYKSVAIDLFAEKNGFLYDLAQGFTHSDFAQHNKIVDPTDELLYLLDFGKTILGSRWEDFARMYYDLENDTVIPMKIRNKIVGNRSTGELFWKQLSQHEKKHTQLFLVYKSLYLLRHHLRAAVKEEQQLSLRGTRIARCFKTFCDSTEYCSKLKK